MSKAIRMMDRQQVAQHLKSRASEATFGMKFFIYLAYMGFLRIVDRTALVVDVPRSSALHQALALHGRRPGITLWCRNPDAPGEFARLHGVGSVGAACPDAGRSGGDQVCLRMTIFAIEWTADGAILDSSPFPEAS